MNRVNWSSVLDAYEKRNPQGFDYFYHFHSMHGLEENDLSPYKRLEEIAEFSEGNVDLIVEDLEKAAIAFARASTIRSVVLSEDGILLES